MHSFEPITPWPFPSTPGRCHVCRTSNLQKSSHEQNGLPLQFVWSVCYKGGEWGRERETPHAPLSGSLSGPQSLTWGRKTKTKNREKEREKGQSHKRKARHNLKQHDGRAIQSYDMAEPSPHTWPHHIYVQKAPWERVLLLWPAWKKKRYTYTHVCMYLNRHASKNKNKKRVRKGKAKLVPPIPFGLKHKHPGALRRKITGSDFARDFPSSGPAA